MAELETHQLREKAAIDRGAGMSAKSFFLLFFFFFALFCFCGEAVRVEGRFGKTAKGAGLGCIICDYQRINKEIEADASIA